MTCVAFTMMNHHFALPSSSSSTNSFAAVHERLGRLQIEDDIARRTSTTSSSLSSSSSSSIDINTVRKEVTKLIELMLRSQLPSNVPQIQLTKMAQHLSISLYKSSPTIMDYCNTTTLQARLQTALKSMKSKLLQKQKRISKSKLRTMALKESFNGDDIMESKVTSLVEQIKKEKNELVGSSCSQCKPKEGPSFNAFRPSNDTKTLPKPLQTLFFQTPLVDAYDKYNPTRLSKINWSLLVEQAKQHLHTYYEWKSENYVCYRSS